MNKCKFSAPFTTLFFITFAITFCACSAGSGSSGQPYSGEAKETKISGILAGSVPEASPIRARFSEASVPPRFSEASVPLAGYQLYCATTTEPKVEGIGISDSAGNVTVVLNVQNATISCSVLDPAGTSVGPLYFTDAEGTIQGDLISGGGSINLGPININLDAGVVQAIIPTGSTIVPANFPETTIASGPQNPTTLQTGSFNFSCGQGNCTFECSLDSAGWEVCTSPKNYTGLTLASHTFRVRAKDTGGNIDPTPASYGWTVVIFPSSWLQIASGDSFNCAIAYDHSLWCWGNNKYGQLGDGTSVDKNIPIQVGTGTDWVQVAGGGLHACAVKTNGSLWCWGYNGYKQTGWGSARGLPSQVGTENDWKQVTGGSSHTCAVKTNGSLWCWGDNSLGQMGVSIRGSTYIPNQVGTGTDWKQVTGGSIHTCAVKTNGSLWCWGARGLGQLGNGDTSWPYFTEIPTQVGAATDWDMVTGGDYHTCAVKTNGMLWCWGYNYDGQLGDGTNGPYGPDAYKSIPVQVGAGNDWKQVAGGGDHTCSIKNNGTLWCWGMNRVGQLGDGSTTGKNMPSQVGNGTDWGQVQIGSAHTCAVKTNGTLWCWGSNGAGQLGDGTGGDINLPTQVVPVSDWDQVSGGGDHTCAVQANGTLWCWGDNHFGKLGIESWSSPSIPSQVGTGNYWKQVSGGGDHTCAIQTSGTLWCWGYNNSGELGNGTTADKHIPTKVGSGTDWKMVTGGDYHTCAIQNNGTLWCWGTNWSGKLGDGTTVNKTAPTQVGTGIDWKQVSGGYRHTCAIQTSGTLWCWGDNNSGELGDGTTANKTAPTQVGTGIDWKQVSVDYYHTCAAKTDGSLWCWGNNYYGQLGDGTNVRKNIPTRVGTASDWEMVTGGYGHTCAVKTNGTLWCWGHNKYGQLGDGTWRSKNTPTQVGAGTDWEQVTVGDNHTCALKTNGWLWCWGEDAYGQLGNGSSWKNYPVEITCMPDTYINSMPESPTSNRDAAFQFTCNRSACTFECKIDSGEWSACASPQYFTGLSLGPHNFQVRAKNESGNDPSPASFDWIISEHNSWTATTTANAPSARTGHSAVWTGTEMVVWGGVDELYPTGEFHYLNTGGRYDPVTDSWTATTTTNAPAARDGHAAVWTGTEMIVWGGFKSVSPYYHNTGGRYNPTTNAWTETTTTNAPSGRERYAVIWTGSEMIIWGGYAGGPFFDTGGRYDPITNFWTATTTTNAPSARVDPTAVWTGTEMIIWGGGGSVELDNTGGRYNPTANSWTATTTTFAPSARQLHTAVWTGTYMIVWGGLDAGSNLLKTGGRYTPATDYWTGITTTGAPEARLGHAAVWTGSEMIIWGGGQFWLPIYYNSGGKYNPTTNSWTETTTTNAPSPGGGPEAIWTGLEMIVWGGWDGTTNFFNTGGRYVP